MGQPVATKDQGLDDKAGRDTAPKDMIADLLRRGPDQPSGALPPVRHRVRLPLVQCGHEAPRGEEMTPERVAEVLIEEEAGAPEAHPRCAWVPGPGPGFAAAWAEGRAMPLDETIGYALGEL